MDNVFQRELGKAKAVPIEYVFQCEVVVPAEFLGDGALERGVEAIQEVGSFEVRGADRRDVGAKPVEVRQSFPCSRDHCPREAVVEFVTQGGHVHHRCEFHPVHKAQEARPIL